MTTPAHPLLVGLSGYATTGKDAAAPALLDDGYTLAGFSDGICEVAYEINPAIHGTYRLSDLIRRRGWDFAANNGEVDHLMTKAHRAVKLPVGKRVDDNGVRDLLIAINPWLDGTLDLRTVVDAIGWVEAKRLTEVRELLQRTGGPEGGRKVFGQSVWIDTVLAKAAGRPTVVTGVRFPDEVHAIEGAGGVVIRVDRPGVGPANTHSTEISLDGYPFAWRITNDSTLDVLRDRLRSVVYEGVMDAIAAETVASYTDEAGLAAA